MSIASLVKKFEQLDALPSEAHESMDLEKRFFSLLYDHGVERVRPLFEQMEQTLGGSDDIHQS